MAEQRPSSEFQWQPRLSEKAVFGGMQFDVAKAKELIKATPRPVESHPTGNFRVMYLRMEIRIDWEKAKAADLAFPVIACMHDGHELILDGWHRYALAIRTSLAEIPVVMLTEDEAKAVRRA